MSIPLFQCTVAILFCEGNQRRARDLPGPLTFSLLDTSRPRSAPAGATARSATAQYEVVAARGPVALAGPQAELLERFVRGASAVAADQSALVRLLGEFGAGELAQRRTG